MCSPREPPTLPKEIRQQVGWEQLLRPQLRGMLQQGDANSGGKGEAKAEGPLVQWFWCPRKTGAGRAGPWASGTERSVATWKPGSGNLKGMGGPMVHL